MVACFQLFYPIPADRARKIPFFSKKFYGNRPLENGSVFAYVNDMLSNTNNNPASNACYRPLSRSQRRGTLRRRIAILAAAIGIAATPMAARAAAPPPVPVAVSPAVDAADDYVADFAPESPVRGAGAAAPPHLRKRAAPIAAVTGGAAVPVPVRPGPAGGGAHIVRAGETLWSVAAVYARSGKPGTVREMFDALLRANRARFGAGDPNLIFPGELLRIPSPMAYRHE